MKIFVDGEMEWWFDGFAMARKRKYDPPPVDSQHSNFEVGCEVVVQRPNMWAGEKGVVSKVDVGLHIVRVAGKHGPFHVQALAAELRFDL